MEAPIANYIDLALVRCGVPRAMLDNRRRPRVDRTTPPATQAAAVEKPKQRPLFDKHPEQWTLDDLDFERQQLAAK